MNKPFAASRGLTPTEERILEYVSANPGRTTEDIAKDMDHLYKLETVVYAVRFLISDGYVDENEHNGALTVRIEQPHSESLREP